MNEVELEAAPGGVRSFRPTPLQLGMLFHNLQNARDGVDVEQIVVTLPEAIDAATLARAWNFVVERSDTLRSSFRWHGGGTPLMDVASDLEVALREEDWRGTPASELPGRMHDFLDADRREGFALDRAPLLRLALFRTGETAYEFVWTFHHIIADGRSHVIVLRDAFARYDELVGRSTRAWPPVARFSDHLERLAERCEDGEAFWRERLANFRSPTPLPVAFPEAKAGGAGERRRSLSTANTSALEGFRRACGVTTNTLVQAAWALVLARHCGEGAVVFGAIRACRRSTVPGADEIAGAFINTVPVRIAVDEASPLGFWLSAVRDRWSDLRAWELAPLPSVAAWSDVPSGTPLFESIVMYDRRTLEAALHELGG
ncbi:MAG: non-ribosomal peptide synthetase, partial [Candidatus Eremiobacteraeota bacterium]|nr:non-ribosomal peptide synthetase [Candidatus Eremiobacteraeota bacterium]